MPKTWSCPFWRREEPLRVYCEAGRIEFADAAARLDYIDRHCAAVPGWEDCSLAQNLCRHYERRRNGEKYRQNQEP